MPAIDNFWAVIPAGGAGTRLWPLSRSSSPKFLHDLTGTGQSLLQDTWTRLVPLAEERFLVVTGRAHEDAVREQLPAVGADGVLAEPSPRDSMAAIGLAAALLERADPDAVMGSFAADHVIRDPDAFGESVEVAVAAARDGWLVTLGIEPTFPSSAFGYIHLGEELTGHPGAYAVREFVEKPSTETAEAYLATGRYRWNAGMFVVRPTVLLDLLAQWHPEFAATLRDLAKDVSRLDELWPGLPKIALDHAIAEPAAAAGRVVVVPAAFGWDDIGDFDSLAGLLGERRRRHPGPRRRRARPGGGRHRARGAAVGTRGRGRGPRRRRRGRHPRRVAGHDPGTRPAGQAGGDRPAAGRPGRPHLGRVHRHGTAGPSPSLRGGNGGRTLVGAAARQPVPGSRQPEVVMIERLRQPGGRLGTLSLASAITLAVIGILGMLAMLVALPSESDFWSDQDSDKVAALVLFAITAAGAAGFVLEDRWPWLGAALSVLGGLALAVVLVWTLVAVVVGLGAAVVAVLRARALHGGQSHVATTDHLAARPAGQAAPGSGESVYGYSSMKSLSASPETSEQYCQTPSWLSASVPPEPPTDQCVNATCWPLGNFLPPSSSDVHGTALNLVRRLEVPASLSAIALSSSIAASSSAIVSSYQRIV